MGRRSALASLVALLTLQVVASAHWIERDSEAFVWDTSEHAQKVLRVHHALFRTEPPLRARLLPAGHDERTRANPMMARVALGPVAGFSNLVEATHRGSARPSFSYQPAGLLLGVLGTTPDAIALAQGTLWFALLIVATFLLGSAARDRSAGLLAAALVSSYPIFLGLSHIPMLDTALATLTTLSMAALLRCDGLRLRRASLALGLAGGLAMLAKQSAPLVLALPILWLGVDVMRSVRSSEHDAAARVRNAAGAALVGLLVCAPWYVVNLSGSLEFLFRISTLPEHAQLPPTLSVDGLLFYPRSLVRVALGPAFTFLAGIGCLWLCLDRGVRFRGPILLALGGAALVLISVHNKDPRHLTPLLPLLAVISALVVLRIPKRAPRQLAVATAVVVAGATLHASTLGDLPVPGIGVRSPYTFPPRSQAHGFEEILAAVDRHRRTRGGTDELRIVEPQPPVYAQHLTVLTLPGRLDRRDGHDVDALQILPARRRERSRPQGLGFVLVVGHDARERERAKQIFPDLDRPIETGGGGAAIGEARPPLGWALYERPGLGVVR